MQNCARKTGVAVRVGEGGAECAGERAKAMAAACARDPSARRRRFACAGAHEGCPRELPRRLASGRVCKRSGAGRV